MSNPAISNPSPVPPADDPAHRMVAESIELIDTLSALVAQETELVGAGKLRAATKLAFDKADLAGRYQAATVRLKAQLSVGQIDTPPLLEALRERHEHFRALLQVNRAVLATAHAVAEGLIRGAADEVARKSIPQGYGERGQVVAPPPRTARPVAVSRAC